MLRKCVPFLVLALLAVGCASGDTAGRSETSSVSDNIPSPSAVTFGRARTIPAREIAPSLNGRASYANDTDLNTTGGIQLASDSKPKPQRVANRWVVRSAALQVRVQNIDQAEKKVNAVVQDEKGILESASSNDLTSPDASMKMRLKIPVDKFDETIAKLESFGTRMAKTVSMQDITDPVIDLAARLKSLRASEESTRRLLAANTSPQNVYGYQNELANVRSQIESLQAQLDAHEQEATYSTLDLTLTQGAVPGAARDPNWLAQAYGSASSSATGALQAVATVFLWLLFFSPFYIPVLAAGWFGYRFYNRRRVIQQQPQPVGGL